MKTALSPAQQLRLESQLALADRALALGAPRDAPYAAHLRIRSAAGRTTELLFGDRTRSVPGLALLDWRTAPLAEVLLGFEEGEEYELEVAGRTLEGLVLERNLVAFERSELVSIATADATLRRTPCGWRAAAPPSPPPLDASRSRPRPTATEALALDAEQRRAVELPPGRAVLVLGEAGAGKTVVALRRLARLRTSTRGRAAGAVVVPTEGLRALAASLVERLGLSGVETWTYDGFAAMQARRAFPDIPRRASGGASGAVVRLKRHPALRAALARLALRLPALPGEDERRRPSRALARWDDLHALYGDRELLEEVIARAGGELPGHAADEVRAHSRIQFDPPAEEAFAHVIPEARRTVDGRPLDAGTPEEDAATVDAEDHAVLLELDRLRAAARGGRAATLRRYGVVVLDAQELAPLELALVGRSVSRDGTLVVAGDAAQQVDAAAAFGGWDAALSELGAADADRIVLGASYRCPPEVTAWARRLRASPGSPVRAGFPVQALPSSLHVAAALVERLRAHTASDPGASVAVICRTADGAAELARALSFGLDVALALSGRFTFRPGVQVTCVEEVKGLEFDDVIVPDASADVYPDTEPARRALYVAITRALRQVLLLSPGAPTPLAAPRSRRAAAPVG